MSVAKAQPGATLLDPGNHALVLIDYQAQMAFATRSIDGVTLRNNAALISRAAAEFIQCPSLALNIVGRAPARIMRPGSDRGQHE